MSPRTRRAHALGFMQRRRRCAQCERMQCAPPCRRRRRPVEARSRGVARAHRAEISSDPTWRVAGARRHAPVEIATARPRRKFLEFACGEAHWRLIADRIRVFASGSCSSSPIPRSFRATRSAERRRARAHVVGQPVRASMRRSARRRRDPAVDRHAAAFTTRAPKRRQPSAARPAGTEGDVDLDAAYAGRGGARRRRKRARCSFCARRDDPHAGHQPNDSSRRRLPTPARACSPTPLAAAALGAAASARVGDDRPRGVARAARGVGQAGTRGPTSVAPHSAGQPSAMRLHDAPCATEDRTDPGGFPSPDRGSVLSETPAYVCAAQKQEPK